MSRAVAVGTAVTGLLGSRAERLTEGLTLSVLLVGMPHGAADTELLARAAHGSRGRHTLLLTGYAGMAAASALAIDRGGARADRLMRWVSAVHFAEGEVACWPADTRSRRLPVARAVAAALATIVLPAAVDAVGAGPDAALRGPFSLERPGVGRLLADGRVRRCVVAAGGGAALLAARGDREPALDTVVLSALALTAPGPLGFAAYFGGWHAVRHTARVLDDLPADPDGAGALRRAARLTARSAWAAAVGGIAAVGLALHAGRTGRSPSRQAFTAVLGLTVPHLVTVAATLRRRPVPVAEAAAAQSDPGRTGPPGPAPRSLAEHGSVQPPRPPELHP